MGDECLPNVALKQAVVVTMCILGPDSDKHIRLLNGLLTLA